MEEGEEVRGFPIIAGRRPPRGFELIKGAFNPVPLLVESPPLSPGDIDFDPIDSNAMAIERRVSKKKGSWWQLPKDLEIQEDDEN